MFKELFVAAQGGKGAAGRASTSGQSKAKAFGGRAVTKGDVSGSATSQMGGRSVTRGRMTSKASRLTTRREK